MLTNELVQLIAKHPEIKKNLENLDQILEDDNIPSNLSVENAMSSRKS